MWLAEISDTYNLMVGGVLAIVGTVVWIGVALNVRPPNRPTNGS